MSNLSNGVKKANKATRKALIHEMKDTRYHKAIIGNNGRETILFVIPHKNARVGHLSVVTCGLNDKFSRKYGEMLVLEEYLLNCKYIPIPLDVFETPHVGYQDLGYFLEGVYAKFWGITVATNIRDLMND